MQHLTIRLQLAWLTVVALAAFVLLAALNPAGGVLDAEFARDLTQFRASLRPDDSIATLNAFRAQLAADMVFLVAYGLLLRQSVRALGQRRGGRLAQHGAVVVMVADATENLCALVVLAALIENEAQVARWWFVTMNAAAFIKWASAGAVLLFLGVGWRSLVPGLRGALKFVGRGIAVAFAVGGVAALIVALGAWYRPARAAATVALLVPAIGFLLQFRLLDMIGVMLRFVYLTRVPLAVLLTIAAFGPIALGPAVALLGGILDVPSWWGVAVVAAASLVLAFACGTQINLVRAYGWQRTFDVTLLVLRHRVLARAVSWTVVVAVSSLLFSVALASLRMSNLDVIKGLVAGTIVAFLFLFVVELIAAYFAHGDASRVMPQLAIPFTRVPLLGDLLRDAYAVPPAPAVAAVKGRVRGWSIAGKLFGLASGYIESVPGGGRRLLPGHTFALVQLALSLAFYITLLYWKVPGGQPATPVGSPATEAENVLWVPTAGSVVLLLLVTSWGLAGLTFFFDRYRTPLFTALIAIVLITGSRAYTDHEIRTNAVTPVSYQLASPGQVLAAFPTPLVIAAAGGGIQAGAWTARVLEGIDQQLKGTLRDRLALVSGVSGGSMGALYYGAFRDANLADATKRALEPSLDEIASALIGADLVRVLGAVLGKDRGEALERSWALRLPAGSDDITVRRWAENVRRFSMREEGAASFPAFLFNTTIVETGQPMAFATTQFPTTAYRRSFSRALKQYPVAESANQIFNLSTADDAAADIGLRAVTAARLSAAFPYISPAATLRIDDRQRFHLVDGGYYDNYGLVGLTQWLDDALEETAARPPEVGVVVIRGLVESSSGLDRELREHEQERALQVEEARVSNHGWAWQLIAPPSAFLKTRTFGQWAGGNQVLKLLVEKWRERKVTIRPYLFDFPVNDLPPGCRIAPLSWKLNVAQQRCINEGWDRLEQAGSPLWNVAQRTAEP